MPLAAETVSMKKKKQRKRILKNRIKIREKNIKSILFFLDLYFYNSDIFLPKVCMVRKRGKGSITKMRFRETHCYPRTASSTSLVSMRNLNTENMISFLKCCIGCMTANGIIGDIFFALNMFRTLKERNLFMRKLYGFLKYTSQNWWREKKPYEDAWEYPSKHREEYRYLL